MKIYPSVSADVFNLEFNAQGDKKIQLFNLNGSLIQEYNTLDAGFRIDASNLGAGSYLIHVALGQQMGIQKVVVIK